MSEREHALLIRGNIEVVELEGEVFVYNLVEGDDVSIPNQDRAAVALAILGDRDALIERGAAALWDGWDTLTDAEREIARDDVRRILTAIVGGKRLEALTRRVLSAAWTALDMRHGGDRLDEWDRHLKDAVIALQEALPARVGEEPTSAPD